MNKKVKLVRNTISTIMIIGAFIIVLFFPSQRDTSLLVYAIIMILFLIMWLILGNMIKTKLVNPKGLVRYFIDIEDSLFFDRSKNKLGIIMTTVYCAIFLGSIAYIIWYITNHLTK
jgi:hypothetical protein